MMNQQKLSAAVYIGASSVQLLLAGVAGNSVTPVNEFTALTRLSEDLTEDASFSPEALERTRTVLTEFRKITLAEGISGIRAAASSTLSAMPGRTELMTLCREVLGTYPAILSMRDESRLIYHGVVTGEYAESPVIAVYNGYNSTPAAFGIGERIEKVYSFPAGAGRIGREYRTAQEAFGFFACRALHEKTAAFFQEFREDVKTWKKSFRIAPTVFLAGPFPTACAKLFGERFDESGDSFSAPIPAEKMTVLSKKLLTTRPENRAKIPGMDQSILPYAAACSLLMSEFLSAAGEENFIVAPSGFCMGLLKLPGM